MLEIRRSLEGKGSLAKDDKISLTEHQVRRLADDEASYQRGVAYYESGANGISMALR
jgi:hypothetical protein